MAARWRRRRQHAGEAAGDASRDAIVLRDHIMTNLERLSITGQHRDVAVTVIGGGATGVELAGTLAELRSIALAATFPEIDQARVHVRLVEQAPTLLAPFDPALRDYARRQLIKRGVDVRLGVAIREVTPNQVLLADGTALGSDTTVWAAGVAAPDAVAGWGLPQGRGGRILTGSDLRVSGQDRIFAVGDIALIEDQPLPQLAQPALQLGRHAAEQISRLLRGQPTVPFSYHDKGIMATIGRRSAVVQLPRHVRVRGTLAWFAWLALHLVTLLGGRNRISALVNLSWRYLTWRRGGGLIVGDDEAAAGGTLSGPLQPARLKRPGQPGRPGPASSRSGRYTGAGSGCGGSGSGTGTGTGPGAGSGTGPGGAGGTGSGIGPGGGIGGTGAGAG